jgi:hypothetical protein
MLCYAMLWSNCQGRDRRSSMSSTVARQAGVCKSSRLFAMLFDHQVITVAAVLS